MDGVARFLGADFHVNGDTEARPSSPLALDFRQHFTGLGGRYVCFRKLDITLDNVLPPPSDVQKSPAPGTRKSTPTW